MWWKHLHIDFDFMGTFSCVHITGQMLQTSCAVTKMKIYERSHWLKDNGFTAIKGGGQMSKVGLWAHPYSSKSSSLRQDKQKVQPSLSVDSLFSFFSIYVPIVIIKAQQIICLIGVAVVQGSSQHLVFGRSLVRFPWSALRSVLG